MSEVAAYESSPTRTSFGWGLHHVQLAIPKGAEEDFRPQRKAHPGILVGDLDALARRVENFGLTVEWDENFPGMRRFYLWDNNGNRLEFLSPEGSELVQALR